MALEIFRLVGSVFVDTDKAEDSLQKTDKKAEGVGNQFSTTIKTAGKWGAAIIGAATAAAAAITALVESTREYRTEQALLETAFESADYSAETARKTYVELNSVLGDSGQAVEAAGHLARLCSTEEDLAKWTKICTGVYGVFGKSLPIEGLTEAANETAKVGRLTGVLADALNWAGVSEDNFNKSLAECVTEAEREALIRETLNELYSEAADLYKENNDEVIAANEAQDRLNNAMAEAGEALEPLVTLGKNLIAAVLEKALPFITVLASTAIPMISNGISTVVGWVNKCVKVVNEDIPAAANRAAESFANAVSSIQAKWEGLKAWFGTLVNGIVTVFTTVASGIGNAFKTPLNFIIGKINEFISGLNSIRIPSWVPAVGGKSLNISTIPYLEEGAVLERGQTGFLEGNGAEAVVPLHKNKKWISAVAEDMESGGIGRNSEVDEQLLRAFLEFVAELPFILGEALDGTKFKVNEREFARLVKAVN